MEARSAQKRWTYAEYARLPTGTSTRYEIIAGELVVTPSPNPRHQAVVTHLSWLLYGFVRQHGLGRLWGAAVDVLFAEGDYLEPDLTFVRAGREDVLTPRGVEGPPDLVVEVLSPSTAARDSGVKLERYRLYGVGEYWIVDPEERSITVWKLAEGRSEPLVHGPTSTLRWTPEPGGPTLDVSVAELFSA
jgi:Uma2 family endonuclease